MSVEVPGLINKKKPFLRCSKALGNNCLIQLELLDGITLRDNLIFDSYYYNFDIIIIVKKERITYNYNPFLNNNNKVLLVQD